jgi:hypothetical protein
LARGGLKKTFSGGKSLKQPRESNSLRGVSFMTRFVLLFAFVLARTEFVLSQQNSSAKTGTGGGRTTSLPIDLNLAKNYFDEARRLAEADGGKLWGKSLAGPLLFVEPRTRYAVANQADAEKKLSPFGGVFVGSLPASVPLANTACRWAGTHWSMVLWPLPSDSAERSVMLMHESWHRIQADVGLPAKDPTNGHLDTLPGRYWLQLEWRALRRALSSTGDEQSRALGDALRFREFRRGLFKTARIDENGLELNEGLAEYTGLKLSGLSGPEQQRHLTRHLETYPAMLPTYVRSFAYLTGPSYGLLLDQKAAGWLRRIRPGDDLGQVLATALNLVLKTESESSARQRATRYDGVRLWAAETAREQARLAKVAAFRRLLVDGPVLMLPLSKFQMSFNPTQLVPIEGAGTVYPTLTLIAPWGKLEVHNASLVASNFRQASVPAPFKQEEKTLVGDGWQLRLNAGWKAVNGDRKGDWKVAKEN